MSVVYGVNINWEPLTGPYHQTDGNLSFCLIIRFDDGAYSWMHVILVMFSSPVCALSARHCTGPALIIFFPLPDFDFLTTNMFPLNSDWIALDRCVMCQRRKATLLLYCKTSDITRGKIHSKGTKQGWEVNTYLMVTPLHSSVKSWGVWCTNWGLLIPWLSSVSWTDAPHLLPCIK